MKNDAPLPVGLSDLGGASTRFSRVLRSGVLPIFVATCALEAVLLIMLPGPTAGVVAAMFQDPAWGILDTPVNGAFLGLLVLLFSVLELFRAGLFAPMRRIALDDVELDTGETLSESVRRLIPIFLVKQLIGLLILGATLLFVLLGVQLVTIPYALVTFVFAPAVYLVAAHDSGLLTAMRESITIARRNPLAVFGVQTALMSLAVWLGEFIQFVDRAVLNAPFATAWAVVGVVLIYRFAYFYGMSVLFLALDEKGHCSRSFT